MSGEHAGDSWVDCKGNSIRIKEFIKNFNSLKVLKNFLNNSSYKFDFLKVTIIRLATILGYFHLEMDLL